MTRHKSIYGLFSVLLLLLFSVSAFADTVQGRVVSISSSALDMTVYDNQGRPYPNALHLKVDRSTRLNGISSRTALRKKDAVQVSVRQETTGIWRADSITKLETTATVQSSTAQASPSLMDALKSPTGQKVIRNGLTGALTGAVASGATGGKAGKGALIGAGVGIAGGLLADMFSGNSQSQNSSATVSSQQESKN